MTGRIHNLINQVPIGKKEKVSIDETSQFILPESININNLKINDIYKLTDTLDKYRIEKKRIKKTPNNPQSSRSHLYMVFEIEFTTGKTGYITIVDTAGRESPRAIFKTFLKTEKTSLPSIMAEGLGISLIEKYKKDPSYNNSDILEILREGFYINETINHLIYYFKSKQNKKPKIMMQSSDLNKYKEIATYISPVEEIKYIDPTNNCLMIPILRYLDDNLSKGIDNEWKPTKFICLVAVRQEEKYCEQTLETISFASDVKSS